MTNHARPVGVVDPSSVSAPVATTSGGDQDHESAARRQAEHAAKAANYRLVIEEGPVQGTFVYKTLDSSTGEIIRQFPREQVLQMAERGDYAAGGLIDTSA